MDLPSRRGRPQDHDVAGAIAALEGREEQSLSCPSVGLLRLKLGDEVPGLGAESARDQAHVELVAGVAGPFSQVPQTLHARSNVELTGAARLYRAASRERSERG